LHEGFGNQGVMGKCKVQRGLSPNRTNLRGENKGRKSIEHPVLMSQYAKRLSAFMQFAG
jgi:hypothetical protein